MEEKRMVDFTLVRRCFFKMEKALTKSEFQELCKFVDWGEHGADIMFLMGDDVTRNPDDFEDEVDCLWEDFDDYPLVKKQENIEEGSG